jgi:hypothetical protein
MIFFNLLLAIASLMPSADAWSIIERPLSFFDLNSNSNINLNPAGKQFLYEYANMRDDQYRLLKHDESNRYLVIGAKDRIITISLGNDSQIRIAEVLVPKYPESDEIEYILAMIPIEPSLTNLNNMLVCKSGAICPRCTQAQFDATTGVFYGFDATSAPCAPPFISQRSLEHVMYYTRTRGDGAESERVLFTASTQAGGRQYVSLYDGSQDGYQTSRAYKYVGQKAGSKCLGSGTCLWAFLRRF